MRQAGRQINRLGPVWVYVSYLLYLYGTSSLGDFVVNWQTPHMLPPFAHLQFKCNDLMSRVSFCSGVFWYSSHVCSPAVCTDRRKSCTFNEHME